MQEMLDSLEQGGDMPTTPEIVKPKRCTAPPLRTPAGAMPLAQLKQHTERADRASAALNKKYPNGLGEVMERLIRESK